MRPLQVIYTRSRNPVIRYEFACRILTRTEKAYLVEIDGVKSWVPKSQATLKSLPVLLHARITVARWLALERRWLDPPDDGSGKL